MSARRLWGDSSCHPHAVVLIIGFSFSMATSRYDLRKNYEEAAAHAIGTEWVRVGLLPAPDAARLRAEPRKPIDLRIAFHWTRNADELQQLNTDTAALRNEMWSAVQTPAQKQPTPVMALVVSSMNDALNSQDTRKPHGGIAFRFRLGVC